MQLPLRILIVDDHPIFSWGLSALLSSVDIVKSVQILPLEQTDVIQWLQENPTELVLTDLIMPHLDGFDLIQQIRSYSNNIKILVVSSRSDEVAICRALHLGANGYIPKSQKASEFNLAISTIAEGGIYVPEEYLGIASFHAKSNECLPQREKEVLFLISLGLNSKEIAKQLYISEHTVQTYRKRLFKRFEVNSGIELVKKATLMGFLTENQS